MAKKIENARKKAVDKISQKIAMFMIQETYTDEQEVQKLLSDAVVKLDEAVKLMVANDEKSVV